MHTFDLEHFERLIERLKTMNIHTLEDSFGESKGNIVNIRHDVDNDLRASHTMAWLEKSLGVQSTYFILDTAPYWNSLTPGDIKMITSAGHRVGWHNNALSVHYRTGRELSECISIPLRKLRDACDVIGTASHGDPLCHDKGYLNYNVFKGMKPDDIFPLIPAWQFDLSEFGLAYEAYHTGQTHYLSDAGGQWNHKPFEYLDKFEREGGKLQINIHPQWWTL